MIESDKWLEGGVLGSGALIAHKPKLRIIVQRRQEHRLPMHDHQAGALKAPRLDYRQMPTSRSDWKSIPARALRQSRFYLFMRWGRSPIAEVMASGLAVMGAEPTEEMG